MCFVGGGGGWGGSGAPLLSAPPPRGAFRAPWPAKPPSCSPSDRRERGNGRAQRDRELDAGARGRCYVRSVDERPLSRPLTRSDLLLLHDPPSSRGVRARSMLSAASFDHALGQRRPRTPESPPSTMNDDGRLTTPQSAAGGSTIQEREVGTGFDDGEWNRRSEPASVRRPPRRSQHPSFDQSGDPRAGHPLSSRVVERSTGPRLSPS